MRTFRLIGMALLAVVMCVNFSSCSEDNEDDNENGNPIVNGKRLSTVTIEGNYYNSTYYNESFSFSYDKEGRLIRVGGSESFTYSWSENFITITSDDGEGHEAKVALNKNGTVKSYDDNWSSFVFQYDSQNYLIKTNETKHDQYQTNIHYFQWDKGNLTKVSGGSEFEVTQTFDSKMKSNVVMALIRGCDNPYDDSIGGGWNMQLLLATHPNICGNFSKNALHSLCTEGLDTYFEYDKEEYPTKIIEKDSENDEIQAIYTITWE